MAIHKSAIKAHRRSEAKSARNTSIISTVKTFIKKVEGLITANKPEEAKVALREAESQIMKANSKGVIKKNSAARKVSRLSKKVKSISKK